MTDRDKELVEQINSLRKQRNAVLLVHNYQRSEIHDIADFIGDSLELSQKAAATDADVIVFCGVHFMAETAAILCPDRTVLLPDVDAGCPMADMITADRLREKKEELPDAAVVCYVNSSADVKAESDICCTSANAVKVIDAIDDNEILFIPDQYLGHYVSTKTDKRIHLWPGYCPTHARIQPEDITRLKEKYPEARALVHPECRPEVIELADAVLSTSGMCRYAQESDANEIIVGTESGIIYRMQKENPDKTFIPISDKAVCPNMKKITLEKVLWSLKEMSPQVTVPEPIRIRAKQAVDWMLEIV
ncbi:MAG TPA: quinolinate synthase NadA [Dehalococcoidia bacterium]|nr:quinolinate synthase NadA [Dehalococcoidia bacterium]